MGKTLLITRPRYDLPTTYLFHWSKSVIKLAKQKLFTIIDFDPQLSHKPLSDQTAKLFLEPSNQVATTLIKGHSSIEADTRAKNAFRKNIRKLLTGETQKEDSATLRFLFWNMKHQVCLGDPEATVTSPVH